MGHNHKKAKDLAARPYVTSVYLHLTTDGKGYVFRAENHEIEGCKAQGLTMEEVQESLNEVRIDLIEHLLDHNLPVPDPAWVATATEEDMNEDEGLNRVVFDFLLNRNARNNYMKHRLGYKMHMRATSPNLP